MKSKYYVAVKSKVKGLHADIVRMSNEPKQEDFPQYAFMWGGYSHKWRAIQVAMYQNYIIDTPQGESIKF